MAAAQKVGSRAAVIELWLDALEESLDPSLYRFFLQKIKSITGAKLLGVCKSPDEGGTFTRSEEAKIPILKNFLVAGGDFIDADFQRYTADQLQEFSAENLFLSYHDFESVPSNIEAILASMAVISPAVYKLAVTPQNPEQLQSFIHWAKNYTPKGPLILTTMGAFGAEGRDALKTVSAAQFYALSPETRTADGQPILTLD